MRMTHLAATLLVLTGCQTAAADTPVSSNDPVPAAVPFKPAADCPILDSNDWAVLIDDMPGINKQPMMMVSGKVRVPTGGYKLALRLDRIAESYPVQITVMLDVARPTGPASQAIVTHYVNAEFPVPPPVGFVTIRCGRQVIGQINEIVIAL
jgi:hypothetical protein